MHRQPLLTLLRQHSPADATERAMTDASITFVEQHPDCFERSLLIGHVTGSAWIVERGPVSPDQGRVVLIHHRKLDRWFQPGGHCDGDPDVAAVALREAEEETGLTGLQLVSRNGQQPAIFDVDVHTIPARGNIPEHLHYDIRFLVQANPEISFRQNGETNEIRWFSAAEAELYADSESVCRMLRKNWL